MNQIDICCFKNEIDEFNSTEQYNAIINQIDSNPNLEFVKNIKSSFGKPKWKILGMGFGAKTIWGETIYKCRNCNRNWYLSDSDYAWRGYLKLSSGIS